MLQKSITTKLTAAIGLWGNGSQKKSMPLSPSSSPPQSPEFSPSPEKSPSFKSRFFNNYMKNDKKDGGNKGKASRVVVCGEVVKTKIRLASRLMGVFESDKL